jgi:hypothetical protein
MANYVLCKCSEHLLVCAKHERVMQGGGEPIDSYLCPGVEGDTGGCLAPSIVLVGGSCQRPAWAEYSDEHVPRL